MKIVKVDKQLPAEFNLLLQASLDEGFNFLKRLKDEFDDGTNRFQLRGEGLWLLYQQDLLIGIGGLNRDPYTDESFIGRIRHLYISPSHRRQGGGRLLLQAVEQQAADFFAELRLNAQESSFPFYKSMAYNRVEHPQCNHRKLLRD